MNISLCHASPLLLALLLAAASQASTSFAAKPASLGQEIALLFSNDVLPLPIDECMECDSNVTSMVLRYDRTEAAMVKIKEKDETYFGPAMVTPGEEIMASGTKHDSKFQKNSLDVFVDGEANTTTDVSCSEDIGRCVGFGDFLIVEAFSKNSSMICPFGDF